MLCFQVQSVYQRLIIIITTTVFQVDYILGTSASLTYRPQFQFV